MAYTKRSQKLKPSTSKRTSQPRTPSPDDSILETDSEEDEFDDDLTDGDHKESSGNDDEDENQVETSEEAKAVQGVGVWLPDEWHEEVEAEDGEDELTENELPDGEQMVSSLSCELSYE